MEIEDDEILQGFIEESLEHLADIENDLLAIEEAGAAIDEDLVNKVFRAAHSIKGGAGFMGLTMIQELAHAAENVLGLIRSKKLIPTAENINVLLLAADQLKQMIEDVHNSNNVDISAHTGPLNAIFDGASGAKPKTPSASAPAKSAAKAEPPTEPSTELPAKSPAATSEEAAVADEFEEMADADIDLETEGIAHEERAERSAAPPPRKR